MATSKLNKAATPADAALVSVRPLTPVRHDGVDLPEGQVVQMNEDAAAYLVDAGLAERAAVAADQLPTLPEA